MTDLDVELVIKGRGFRVTDQVRRTARHKIDKLPRLNPAVTRIEIEVILEHNPRSAGDHRVEAACVTPRKVFRAEAAGQDLDVALDQVIERLERQMTSHRDRMKDRRQAGPVG
jgi:ribosome hibernation promoting factor